MKYIFTYIAIILLSFGCIQAQNKKALKKLEEKDFAKAKEMFEKELAVDSTNGLANFGMALMFSCKDYPQKDYLKAYLYLKKSEPKINKLNTEEQELLKAYLFAVETRKSSYPLHKKIIREKERIGDDLIVTIREGADLALVNRVLDEFPDYHYYDNTVHIRNYLAFREAEKANTVKAYNDFIKDFADAAQVPQAVKQRDNLAFNLATKTNTIEAYDKFMKEYPKSIHKQSALMKKQHLLFLKAKGANSISALEDFIENYPHALDVLEAKNLLRKLIYEKAKQIKSMAAYNDFIKRYPEGAEFIDIYNLKSSDLGREYTKGISVQHTIKMARGFDYTLQHDYDAKVRVQNDNSIILGGNTSVNKDANGQAWFINLTHDAKFLWNKTLGDTMHDRLSHIAINSSSEIIGVGYTNSRLDTFCGIAWVNKIDSKGKKKWNRTLPMREATGIVINQKDDMFISGYRKDSLYHPLITKINKKGKKLWTRKYITPGKINELYSNEHGGVVIQTDRWVYSLSDQGYLNWEIMLDTTKYVSSLAVVDENKVALAVLDTISGKTEIIKYNQGKKEWSKALGLGSNSTVSCMAVTGDNTRIFVGGNEGNNALLLELNGSGAVSKKSVFNNKLLANVTDIYIHGGDIFVTLNGVIEDYQGDIVLLKIE